MSACTRFEGEAVTIRTADGKIRRCIVLQDFGDAVRAIDYNGQISLIPASRIVSVN